MCVRLRELSPDRGWDISKEFESATQTKEKGKAEVEDPQSHRKAISLDGLWQVGSHEGRKEPSQA
jgi:hypothetical protein